MTKKKSKSWKPKARKRIGEYLVEKKLVSSEDIQLALEHQERWGSRLGEALISLGRVDEDQMYQWLARFLRLPYFRLDELKQDDLSKKMTKLLSEEEVMKHRVVPVQISEQGGKQRFVIATSEPLNFGFLDQLKFRSGAELLVMVSNEKAIDRFTARLFGRGDKDPQYVQFQDYFTNWIDIDENRDDLEDEQTIPYTSDEKNRLD